MGRAAVARGVRVGEVYLWQSSRLGRLPSRSDDVLHNLTHPTRRLRAAGLQDAGRVPPRGAARMLQLIPAGQEHILEQEDGKSAGRRWSPNSPDWAAGCAGTGDGPRDGQPEVAVNPPDSGAMRQPPPKSSRGGVAALAMNLSRSRRKEAPISFRRLLWDGASLRRLLRGWWPRTG